MKLRRILLWASVGLTLVVSVVCVTIELLNMQAGGLLPKDEPGKWRSAPTHPETLTEWYSQDMRAKLNLGEGAPLPPDAQREVEARVKRQIPVNRANNALRAAVESWGLLQYLLCPLAVVMSLLLMVKRQGIHHLVVGGFCMLVSLTAGAFMLYRQYFTSLGW
jgi:hypothetical protein